MPQPLTATTIQVGGDIGAAIASFKRTLAQENKSPATVRAYVGAAEGLARFLDEKRMPTTLTTITREHVEEYIIALQRRWKDTSVAARFQALQAFFKWAVDREEVHDSPMARMKRPKVREAVPAMLREDEVRAILRVCEKDKSFEGKRDAAIVRIFLDTGCRRSEVANLRFNPKDPHNNDVGLDQRQLRIWGKGGIERFVRIGDKTTDALDKYVSARASHTYASSERLWLTSHSRGRDAGRLTESGLAQVVLKRGEEAGIKGAHAHQFRHWYAHSWLAAGGTEGGLMAQCGWKSRRMLQRYGAALATERSHAEHDRLRPGDRL